MNYGYCQDLIPYRVDDKWGYADKAGKLVYEAVYDSVGVFRWNNLLEKHGSMVYQKDKSIYVDKKLTPIFDAAYKNIILDYRGWIIAEKENGKHQLYDTSVNEFNDFTFDTFQTESNFIIAENNGKIGFINGKSEIIIPIEYDQIYYNVFHGSNISLEEYEHYKLYEFNIAYKNYRCYLDGAVLPENKDMIVATVVNNKETKRLLKFVINEENELFGDVEETWISSLRYSEEQKNRVEELSQKKGLKFTECDSKSTSCIFEKDNQFGIYNLKTDTASEMFDEVVLIKPYDVYRVTKNRKGGLYSNSLKVLMPIKYSYFNVGFNSKFLVTASYYVTSSIDSKYDYYNIKTQKYIIKECDFLYRSYERKSSKFGVYFFPVKKNETIFYVNENGIQYKQ
jgi:hypothetical protein